MNSIKSCGDCDAKQCFLFKNSISEQHDELYNKKSCLTFSKNQLIFSEGEKVDGIYFIKKGKIKVHKDSDYRGQIIRFAKDGDILGHRGLGGDNFYPVSATAMEDSSICFVEQGMLFKLMQKNPMLSIRMMLFYADELKKTENRLRNMAVMTVRERIAEALLLINETFAKKNGVGTILDVNLSRKDIAEIAGTYSEQASRYLSEFKDEGMIDLIGKKIVIKDIEKLYAMVEKYCVLDCLQKCRNNIDAHQFIQ